MKKIILALLLLSLISCVKVNFKGFTRTISDYEEVMSSAPDTTDYLKNYKGIVSGFKYDINKGNTFKDGNYVFIFRFPGEIDKNNQSFLRVIKPINNDFFIISNRFLEVEIISKNCTIEPLEISKIVLKIYDDRNQIISQYSTNSIYINDIHDLIVKQKRKSENKLWRNGYCSMGFLNLFEGQVDLTKVTKNYYAKINVWVGDDQKPITYEYKAYHTKWAFFLTMFPGF